MRRNGLLNNCEISLPGMTKKCDNKSVGVIIRNEMGDFLMIERMKFPFGFAPVAGHVDEGGEDYEAAAYRETLEEVGLGLDKKTLLLDRVLENQLSTDCKRGGGEGPWHHWQVYRAEEWSGEVKRSEDETKQAIWLTRSEIGALAERTEAYMRGKISEKEWEASPGLEEVWYRIFKILEIV